MPNTDAGQLRLPPMTVARFKEASLLIERLVSEKTDVFLGNANDYRRKHRELSDPRPLTPQEAAQIAAAMAEVIVNEEDPIAYAARVQESELRAYDEPAPQELLLAAGLATAPALMDAVMRLVALVEMDAERFKAAREEESLDDLIKEDAEGLEELDVAVARERAVAALEHVQVATGAGKGEAWGLLVRVVVQAFSQAMQMSRPATSPTESSTSSLVDTTGRDSTSSTEPASEQP
jgi:hypothetical protein